PFNVTSVGQAAALAALDDGEHVTRSVEMNRGERRRLHEELRKLGLAPVESETNFLFVPIGPRAKDLCDELLEEGVIIRPLGWMGLPEAIRISGGSRAGNTRLMGRWLMRWGGLRRWVGRRCVRMSFRIDRCEDGKWKLENRKWKSGECVALNRRSPPFAEGAKGRAPSSFDV